MTEQLQFERRTGDLWVAELDGGAFYRIEMHPMKLGADYDLTFAERKADTWARKGWSLRYERVSTHRSVERAIERAVRHHRNRAKAS